jgi:hypothetical protein
MYQFQYMVILKIAQEKNSYRHLSTPFIKFYKNWNIFLRILYIKIHRDFKWQNYCCCCFILLQLLLLSSQITGYDHIIDKAKVFSIDILIDFASPIFLIHFCFSLRKLLHSTKISKSCDSRYYKKSRFDICNPLLRLN